MILAASSNRPARARAALAIALVLAGLLSACALPERRAAPVLYDFGSRPLDEAPAPKGAALPALATSVQAGTALDGTDMLYRLAYADERQLRSYAQARWVMPPAELVQQRLRDVLSQQRVVLRPGEGAQMLLLIDLDEFSQLFESSGRSSGELRLRATVRWTASGGNQQLAQRNIRVLRPASSADAAGGVRALSAATDAAVEELAQWIGQLR